MKHLDIFSGIGGFALAARRVGWETVGFCEIDPYCQKVLEKHWPGVPIYEDVRKLPYDSIGPVDIITGGYPCQGESLAGKRLGKDDDRWLGEAFTDAVETLRPRYAVGENVAGHISLGLDTVLSNMERIGYTTETFVIPACAVGAFHRRDRVWIIGHTNENREPTIAVNAETPIVPPISTDTSGKGPHQRELHRRVSEQEDKRKASELGCQARGREVLANTECRGRQGQGQSVNTSNSTPGKERKAIESFYGGVGAKWSPEPNVGRVANGVPRELDLYRGLIGETEHDSQTDSETLWQLRGRLLRAMWKHREVAKTSPDLYRKRLRDSLPEVPHEDSHGGWYLGAWIEENQGLRNLWENFYSKPLEEAQDLQQELFERVRKIERSKEVGPTKDRVHRLKALGNAIVPQVAEVIFRAIDSNPLPP